MREIKFRMWDKYLNAYSKNSMDIAYLSDKKYGIQTGDRYILEQFTGLHDKNGKEIYEGDIVKYEADKESGIAIIEYWPGSFIFNWIKQTTPSPSIIDSAFYFGCHSELEVIGNIHENPELRKQEERDE